MKEDRNLGVSTCHPQYLARAKQWSVMRDCVEGGDRIKEKGTEYLPAASSQHDMMDSYEQRRYENYKKRADYSNYVSQILDCLHGMIENTPSKIEVPIEVKSKGILKNIDYQGNSADQFFSDCLYDILQTGFGGILVDVPDVNPNMSESEAEKYNIRPYMAYYNAESVINWKYAYVNGVKKLVLLVLKEEIDSPDSLFSHKTVSQYRVIRIENGICVREIYRYSADDNGNKKEIKVSNTKPIIIRGENIDYIPFVMTPFNHPVKPILYDIALLNIGHYQKSADYNNGVHLTTLPTGWTTGWSNTEDPKTHEPKPVYLGADTFIQIPDEKAKIGNLSFAGEGLVHCEHALDRTEAQIITLASHIISPEKKTAENKDALEIHKQGEDAKLATYARYMSHRFSEALKIIVRWMGYDDTDVTVTLNTNYTNKSFDANAVNSIANIFSQGKLPLRCLYYLLQSGGYLEPDMTYEGFVYLLDLEASSLNPQEVDEAYKLYQRKGERKTLNTGDWYSQKNMYSEIDEKIK